MPGELASSLSGAGTVQHCAYALQLALGGVFVLSALPKLRRPGEFRATVRGYGVVPARAVAFAAWALTAVEAFLALSFLSGWLVVVAVPLSAVTLAAFAGVTSVNLRRGRDVPCGCFGNAEEQVSARSLVRLALLAAGLAGYAVAVVSPEATPVSADWLGAHSGSVAAYVLEVATLSVALLVAATWTLSARELLTVVRDPPEREPA